MKTSGWSLFLNFSYNGFPPPELCFSFRFRNEDIRLAKLSENGAVFVGVERRIHVGERGRHFRGLRVGRMIVHLNSFRYKAWIINKEQKRNRVYGFRFSWVRSIHWRGRRRPRSWRCRLVCRRHRDLRTGCERSRRFKELEGCSALHHRLQAFDGTGSQSS